jgi:hypothetical protein
MKTGATKKGAKTFYHCVLYKGVIPSVSLFRWAFYFGTGLAQLSAELYRRWITVFAFQTTPDET